MNDRRQFHRYLLHTEIEHEKASDALVRQSMTKDISRGGICISTEESPLDIGDQYRLTFLLPFTDEIIRATARVVWNKQNGSLYDNGLCFIDIDDRYLDLIEEYSIGGVEGEGGVTGHPSP